MQFMKLLLDIGRKEGVDQIFGHILPDNYAMQRVCKNLGYKLHHDRDAEVVEARIKL